MSYQFATPERIRNYDARGDVRRYRRIMRGAIRIARENGAFVSSRNLARMLKDPQSWRAARAVMGPRT